MADNKDKKVLNVPALRFPEFSDEWEKCLISDFGMVITGNTPPTKDVDNYKDGIKLWASPIDLGKSKWIYDTQTKLSVTGFEKTRKLPQGAILVTCIGSTIGKMGMATCEIATNQQINSIITNSDNDKDFVYYAIESKFPKYLTSVAIQAVPIISKSSFERLPNIRTTLTEQKKIGRFLSLIDKRIETQNKIIEKLETLIKGIRHKVFKQLRKDIGFNATIGNILSFEQPQRYIVSSAEYSNDDTFTPVLTANKAFILGYTTETDGIYGKGDCIIIDDFTLDCKYVSFPFKVKSSAIKILTAKNKFILRYAYEYLKSLELSTEEHKRHYIAEVQPHSCVLPDENTLKTIALVFENLACKLANEQSLVLIFNKQKQYLLSKMFI